ncbi:MAG: hypothetical protein BroJett003_18660 [Planctomycetota bacterium]|nr:MAG: hypothetical protein BroJett003_18660 [Planctomycetota bacterium]
MIEVRPFRALRYNFDRYPDISALIAPPYDVLDLSDKEALLRRSDRNIVAVDLPHVPPKSAGPPEAYRRAAETLRSWRSDGTLVHEPSPAMYAYHQEFMHEGRRYTRKMLIATLRLSPFSEGNVLPHEETFGGPKEDRLALMKATACQLSPIFGLYSDPEGEVDTALRPVTRGRPSVVGTLDGVDNRMWTTTDAGVHRAVSSLLSKKKVFIADGHHRYGTALLYRDGLSGDAGPPGGEHPASFIMFVLASMDDPGCLILPYNRVLPGRALADVLSAWRSSTATCGDAEADLRLFDPQTQRTVALKFTQRSRLDALSPEKSPAWRKLDVAYLHRVLIDEDLRAGAAELPKVAYVKSVEQARDTARAERGVALLLNATPMSHLKAVSEAGDLMPQKSTFFAPKLVTGMTMYSLE